MVLLTSSFFSVILGVVFGLFGNLLVSLSFRNSEGTFQNKSENFLLVFSSIPIAAIIVGFVLLPQYLQYTAPIVIGILLGILGNMLIESGILLWNGNAKYRNTFLIAGGFLIISCFVILILIYAFNV